MHKIDNFGTFNLLGRNMPNEPDLLQDPHFKTFLDKVLTHSHAVEHLPISERRKAYIEFSLAENPSFEPVHQINNIHIPGLDNHQIPLRIYIPRAATELPVMVYFHGGGWVYGSIEDADPVCRRFANHLGVIVVSVNYRLAPEFPFPIPLEDCYAATAWVAENIQHFGGNPQAIFVSGESAGGNLAAAVARMARDKQFPQLAAQLLLYPVISSIIQDEVYDRCPDRYFLTKEDMQFFWEMYAQSPEDSKNPYASLDNASEFEQLPPALVVTAEYDPLTPDIEKYIHLLREAHVKVIHQSFPKLIHGFLYIPLYSDQQKVQWTKKFGTALHQILPAITKESQ